MKSNASDYKILPSSANAIADDDYDDDDFVAAKDNHARDKTAHRPNGPVDIDADDVAGDAELGKVDRFRVAAASSATQSSTLRVDGRGAGASRVLTSFRRRLVLPFNSNNNKGNAENCHSETSLLSSTPSPRRRRRGQQLGNFNPTPSMTSRGKVLSSSASINPTYIRGSSLTPIVGNCSTATLPSAGHNHRVSAVLINAERADDRDDDEYYYDLRDATSKSYSPASRACRLTFLFDPAGSFCYYWSLVVSLGFLYNLWVIIYRYTFDEINAATLIAWFCLDYFCDLVYALDVAMQFRTGFLEEGVLQINPTRLRIHYTNSTRFYLDCLSLLPLDFLYLSLGFKSILRSFRLVKVYKFWSFVEKTERHTNFPNVLRGLLLFHSIVLIFHWNACLIYVFRHYLNYAPQYWDKNDNFHNYLNAYYLSCRTLMLIESLPKPHKGSKYGYVFIIFEQVFGLIMLATVLGHVSGIVANVSAARKHFQAQLDAVKTYMHLRKVPNHLQRKVIRWFDYWWSSKKFGNDKAVVECLPDKLKAEIAIHVHLDTLKRVEIFQNTEPGFLCELVIRLKPMLFSPGDYICRKGEVGKEMYIVNRGKLQVLADDGKLVLATLTAGSYFGEISILNMGTEGNRRTASVVSLGYSDLFCLTKKEIWEVLEDYPAARARLELIANKRLQQKAEKLLSMVASRDRFSEKISESPGLPHLLKVASSGNCQRRRGSAPAGIYYSATPSSGNIASGLLYRCNQIISSHNKGTFLEPPAFAPSSGSCLLTTTNSQPFLSSPTKRVNSNVALATTPLMNNANFVANSRRVSSATNASTMFDVAEEDDNDGRGSFEENNDNLEKAQLLLTTSCSSNNSPSKNDQPSLVRNEFKNDALIDSPQTPSLGETFQLTLYSDTTEAFM